MNRELFQVHGYIQEKLLYNDWSILKLIMKCYWHGINFVMNYSVYRRSLRIFNKCMAWDRHHYQQNPQQPIKAKFKNSTHFKASLQEGCHTFELKINYFTFMNTNYLIGITKRNYTDASEWINVVQEWSEMFVNDCKITFLVFIEYL